VQEKEEEITGMLDYDRSELSSHEANLDIREATLEADQKSLGDLCAEVLYLKLVANLKANHLEFREKELVDRDKQLAVTQPRELATMQKRLEGLQAARATKVQKVWDFLG
jgi:hypothetical protein